jgi:hypothetical protein
VTLDREVEPARSFGAADEGSARGSWPARLLAVSTVAPAVVVAAWVLAALPLLLLHAYRPAPAIVLGFAVAALLARPALRAAQARAVAWGDVPWWAVVGVFAVVIGFGVLAYAMSAQDVLIRRDPGSYAMSATWLADHGTIQAPTHAASFGGADPNLYLASQGFYLQGGHIIPQFMTGVPVLMAIGGWIAGVPGVLHMNAFIGALGLLAFAGLVARLVGPRWAPLAVLTLALVQPQLDVMRATYSEPSAQLILLGGLAVVLDALLVARLRPVSDPEPTLRGPDARADPAGWPLARPALFVGALVLGLVSVVRIDAVADLLPMVPFIGWLAFHRQRAWRALALGLGAGLLVGAFVCVFLTLPYTKHVGRDLDLAGGGFLLTIPLTIVGVRAGWASRRSATRDHPRGWPEVGLLLGLLFAALVGILLPAGRTKWHVVAALGVAVIVIGAWALARAVWWSQQRPHRSRSPKWPAVAALGVGLLGAYFVVRPHIATTRSKAGSGGAFYVGQIQGYLGLPVDPTRSYYEQSLCWMSWYFGWATLAFALAGAIWLAHELTRGRRREWLPAFFVFVGMTAAVLYSPSITPDHPWADRRFVPVAIPGLVLLAFAAFAGAVAWTTAAERRWRQDAATVWAARALGVACVGALVVTPAWLGSRHVFTQEPEKGELALVDTVCDQLRPDDAVVAFGAAGSTAWPGTLRVMCGVGTAFLDGSDDAATLQRVADRVNARGGRLMVLVDGTNDKENVPGNVDWPAQPTATLETTEVGHTLVTRPDEPSPLPFVVWLGEVQPTS